MEAHVVARQSHLAEGTSRAATDLLDLTPFEVSATTTTLPDRVSAALHEIAAGSGRDESFEIDLKKGWNVLLVKVANAGKPALIGFRVAGEGLQTAVSPSELPAASTGGP